METAFAASREFEQQRAKQLEAPHTELSGLRIDEERLRERREHQVGTSADRAVRQRQASEEGLDGERSGVAKLAKAVSDLHQSLEPKRAEVRSAGSGRGRGASRPAGLPDYVDRDAECEFPCPWAPRVFQC